MAFVSSTRRTFLLNRITTRQAQIDAANTTLETLLSQEYQEYKLNTNEGMQQTVQRKIDELINVIERLEALQNLDRRRIEGTAVMNLDVRRKRPHWSY